MRPQDQSVAIVSGSPAPRSAASLQLKTCETREEREKALSLVYQSYLKAGLMSEHPMGMRVIRQHLLDTTHLMVATQAEEVCFTVTLVRDGEYGLPAESQFGSEIAAMREAGVRMAEVSCTASRCDVGDKKLRFETLVRMIALTIQSARRRGVERLLLAVHPRHAKVYQRLFGCTICTGVKEYDAVQGNPAVLCMHDFAELDQTGYSLYDKMYGETFAPWQLDGTRMTAAEKAFLAQALAGQDAGLILMAA